MRVLVACIIVISTALGLAGCFHINRPLFRNRCHQRRSSNLNGLPQMIASTKGPIFIVSASIGHRCKE